MRTPGDQLSPEGQVEVFRGEMEEGEWTQAEGTWGRDAFKKREHVGKPQGRLRARHFQRTARSGTDGMDRA